jgi:hypothetical protein
MKVVRMICLSIASVNKSRNVLQSVLHLRFRSLLYELHTALPFVLIYYKHNFIAAKTFTQYSYYSVQSHLQILWNKSSCYITHIYISFLGWGETESTWYVGN